LRIKGKGSHAATPYEGTDTPLAARFAVALADFPARHLDVASLPVVVSVMRLLADGGVGGVTPAKAEVSGMIRAFENIDPPSERDGPHITWNYRDR
jgi:metal-dependent amidase/aminoacylase/carboxypeptidase family protein